MSRVSRYDDVICESHRAALEKKALNGHAAVANPDSTNDAFPSPGNDEPAAISIRPVSSIAMIIISFADFITQNAKL